jgi:uncharacterized phage-like protein YoqJ
LFHVEVLEEQFQNGCNIAYHFTNADMQDQQQFVVDDSVYLKHFYDVAEQKRCSNQCKYQVNAKQYHIREVRSDELRHNKFCVNLQFYYLYVPTSLP